MEIKLSKEIEFEGTKYKKIDLDLDALTGKDIIDAESEASARIGRPATDLDKIYHACIAGKAAKIPSEVFNAVPARDFAKIMREVQNFLLGM